MSGAAQAPTVSARSGLVTVNTRGMRDALATLGAALRDAAFAAATSAAKAAHVAAKNTRRFNDVTGGLRQSIRQGSFVGRPATFVSASANHARFVNDGTKPHAIRPRNARMLRFTVNGSTVFARRVMHPGTAPRPFMTDAFVVGWGALSHSLNAQTSAAISRFNRGA